MCAQVTCSHMFHRDVFMNDTLPSEPFSLSLTPIWTLIAAEFRCTRVKFPTMLLVSPGPALKNIFGHYVFIRPTF